MSSVFRKLISKELGEYSYHKYFRCYQKLIEEKKYNSRELKNEEIYNDIYEQLKEICSCVSVPSVAIGGINLDNMAELENSGVDGIAVVSSLFSSTDIQKTAQTLKEKAKIVAKK